MENENYKTMFETLSHKFENAWEVIDDDEKDQCFELCESYKSFLNVSKTERESANEILRLALDNGYESIDEYLSGALTLGKGSKIYAMNRDKSILLFHIGDRPIKDGIHIVGTHIDAPRIDLKPFPLYEDSNLAFFKTHYYGGIKKYQWTTTPLALHGVVINKKGEKINVVIGEDESDPVLIITDLLIHLAKDQNKKNLAEGISAEDLNVLVGQMPFGDDTIKEKVKFNVLYLLNQKYGLREEDFLTAEFELVPAGKARDLGFDRSMITAYAHDDRVCSYTGARAILDLTDVRVTACGMFMDKEEVGSQGNTGSQSRFFENVLAELIALQEGTYNDLMLKRCLTATEVLSGDVGAAFDPNYASAYEKQNSAFIGRGLQLVKYTGSRGKAGCNDANAEFLSSVRDIFEENKVIWQIGELGKVDQGGGGTIAFILANANANVVDCGIPVLSMHSPSEIVSKVDVYMAYKGYHAFLNR